MSSGLRRGATLLLAGGLLLSGGVVAAQDPSPAPSVLPGASAVPDASPAASAAPTVDPCASPLPSPETSPGASPAAAESPALVAEPSAAPSVAPAASPVAGTSPATSAAPTAIPTFDPCAPLESPEPSGNGHSGDKVVKARPVTVSLRKVAEGFSNPNGLVNAGDDRLFVLEQEGFVTLLKPAKDGTFRNAGTFLDIRDRVICCGEKGLLGLAFPPDYADSGRFYVTYAGPSHNWYLDEMRVSKDDPDRADPKYRRSLIKEYKPRDFHWGGNMAFGPDGYLWIGMGDGGFNGGPNDPGDPDNRAQDLSTIFGKFLRIDPTDPDGKGKKTARYTIPADNPYVNKKGARPEIWLRGVRNPWRWSFDRVTGDLWITDVGMHTWEEVNRLKGDDPGKGANLGWRLMEGPDCYNPATGCNRPKDDLTMPIVAYRHEVGPGGFQCAITGGYVYRGERFPALRSWYFFGDYCSGTIFKIDSAGKNRQKLDIALDTGLAISSMGTDDKGEIYVIDYTLNKATAIYRLEGKAKR
jgi:glucose/arabinose dehydrogenase